VNGAPALEATALSKVAGPPTPTGGRRHEGRHLPVVMTEWGVQMSNGTVRECISEAAAEEMEIETICPFPFGLKV
jgi:hypothetical protein